MKTPTRSFQLASLFLAISGALHIAGAMVSGFETPTPQLLAIGVLYLILAFLLRAGRRWLAYIVFVMMIFGAAGSYIFTGSGIGLPDWAYYGITVADLLCAFVLFYVIWRDKSAFLQEA